ncbi:tail tubular protein [Prochlorococcus phage P-SCSP1f]|uniref:Tail tubular protein n=1 Tax=Prochlorococcus phage P-SCSP1u TaxID=2914505 RepID=UPI0022001580|nr:Chain A, Nozzle protein(gp 23) of the cyanophage P-SCSP1u [Prochlorococcus phage P-SCSP1u]8I4M_B Chain B, Nozzle protein(gp 23) of the cyanophage P-SCSP1u [Prochlorococcus phage P-SCSP1u]8I4M_C Chain C, Nozzle protein(gp 23) of the cyanophage P-SCSP1u [Prochlorococcus phage P-SCSP1u]8I4M_D Chain D, Nozzle protein(gp 23) of the cyanophage P-SCSP1u [Prochlorococcus phage P-SCSP1u]8I4M_E Chain E, Nozzle protein(gp 23) of the cyanophage P-SCSP1u [Prochlorococcus phage P-SCSP1u]8I4M_F Chain F, N
MPLISSSIPNLINGVSQQPAALRLASQAEEVINCMPSPVEGLKKRPPMQHIKKLFAGSAGTGRPFTHIVDRDGVIRYLIFIQDNAIKVFDLDGNAQTVSTPNGTSYLNITGEPSSTFRVASIADFTFIVNREKTVAMDTTNKSYNWGTKSMVFIKSADFSTTYRVKLNGTEKSVTTGNSSGSAPDTVTIASDLATQLNTISGFTVTSTDYIIRITKDDGGDYTLESSDTKTADATSAIKGTVDSITDLPTIAEHNFTVRIQGSATTAFDDYFVKFEATAGSGFGPGVWRETVAPNIDHLLDKSTMPHTLVRNANGTFTFAQFNYTGRVAGDTTTAPNPTFVGSKIKNINLFRNRLVFLADENVILSAADSFERFFPETVQTLLDSDPIDISSGGTSVNFLNSSLAFANTLLLFSLHGQFRLDTGSTSVGTALTPKTATITAITTFDIVDAIDPIGVGRTVYFGIPKGDFSGLREYFLPDASGPIPLSEEVTSSVPRFVPGNLISMSPSVSEEVITMISKDQPRRVYIYKFFFDDDQKLQSSWSYWEVAANKTLLGGNVLDSDLYTCVEYSDGVYLEKTQLRPETVDSGTEFEILLDRKTTEAACSTSLINSGALGVQTVITLPYPMSGTGTMAVVGRFASNNTIAHGQVIKATAETLTGGASGNGTMTVPGDLSSAKFFVGEIYNMTYEFSTPYLKETPPGGGLAVLANPRLQLRTWSIVFDETSNFSMKITPGQRDELTYPFNGYKIGSGQFPIGTPSLATGRFRVPVMAQNIETKIVLFSDSPLPCRVQSAEWEGWYQERARRL